MKNRTFRIACSTVFGLALTLAVSGQESGESNLPVIERPGFEPLAAALAGKTRVPPVIPSSLPRELSSAVDEFFCTIITLEPDEYEVVIGWGPDCRGGTACRIGGFSGMRSRRGRIGGSRNYPFEARQARRVRLYGGIQGYYVDSTCGANCSDSTVHWRQGYYEYMVGLKAGSRREVIEFANLAIRNSLGTRAPNSPRRSR